MRTRLIPTLAGLLACTLALEARADRRAFTRTYEYQTQPKGNLELEFYNTQETLKRNGGSPTKSELQVEVEYGLTDHWDVSIYQVFGGAEAGNTASPDADAETFGYRETKLRTRYRFAERGEWPVDVLLYGEIIKPFGVAAVGGEAKLIVARDLGKVTIALNAILEVEPEEELAGGGVEVEYEVAPEAALGVTYELVPELKIGVEAWGALKAIGDDEEGAIYAGPAIGWAPSHKLWLAATAGFRVLGTDDPEKAKAEANVRFILGLGL